MSLLAQASGGGGLSQTFVIGGVLIALFYLLIHRPQLQRQKDQEAMQNGLPNPIQTFDKTDPSTPSEKTKPYKIVPFCAAVSNTQGASHLAAQIEGIISHYSSQGWVYVGVHQLQTFKAGSSGCFGFGATPPTTITTEFLVFRQ